MRASYVDVHRGRKNIERFTFQQENFSIDQHVDRNRNIKFDMFDAFAAGERMLQMSPGVEPGQHTQQIKTADRTPANKFDVTVSGIGIGSDKHRAARILAVVECEKEEIGRASCRERV